MLIRNLLNQLIPNDNSIISVQDFLQAIETKQWLTDGNLKFLIGKKVGIEGAINIAALIGSGKCPPGMQIKFFNCNIGGAEGLKIILSALNSKTCPNQIEIEFWNNNLKLTGAKIIAEFIQHNRGPNDLQLCIANNKMGPIGTKLIAKELK